MSEEKRKYRQRICDTCEEDTQFLANFNDQLKMLTGMVVEIIETEPRMLLSPVMRQLLLSKAKQVDAMHGPLALRLCVDNPGEPLQI